MKDLFTKSVVKARKLIDEHEVYRVNKDAWHNCDIDQYVWVDDVTEDKVVMQQIFKDVISTQIEFYCPLCKSYNAESEYLATVFTSTKTKWLANMITHYRHSHTDSWDRIWGAGGYGYHNLSQITYSIEKERINNISKRQIIKKASDYLVHHNINENHFKALHGTDKKTFVLADKILNQKAASENKRIIPDSSGA
ncbi:MAG: hypothetical protein WD266_09440 [Balneolales bacterium]